MKQLPVIIVGNKIDEINRKNVCIDLVKAFADKHKLEFIESSAKTGENVDQIFEKLAMNILKSIPTHSLPTDSLLEAQNESPESEVISIGTEYSVTQVQQTNPKRKHTSYVEMQARNKNKSCC
ncbi:hypothetical protein NPIL_283531 [Nephila pilipes]|uniref:Uncharacterized protein n=1 Tax=Nephila pilipes TaxID=299642 RepID=A0A8X6R334_NEPPI|nr:hypothetical protein NPIL_283531 [Nephila pilipes]